jgi:hypothetical protein
MTEDEQFDAWAPRDSPWAPWVKPVLFAHAAGPLLGDEQLPPAPSLDWLGNADGTVLVIDLNGPVSVAAGLALAARGFRPVPLFNAVPGPPVARAKVDVWPIVRALASAAPLLLQAPLPAAAPPAFLLDATRRGAAAREGADFDNRSVSFPTDFPSGNLLRSRGFTRAVLVQAEDASPQPDLAHTLRRWQEAGIAIEVKALTLDGPPVPTQVQTPSWARLALYRLLALAGLRRAPLGGFGGQLEGSGGASG